MPKDPKEPKKPKQKKHKSDRKHPKIGEEWTQTFQDKKTEKIKKEMSDAKSMEDDLIKMFSEKITRIKKDQDHVEYLDAIIDDVEDMLFLCVSLKGINKITGVQQYKFFKWTRESQFAERIQTAYMFSSETRMEKGQEILEKYILDPMLTMAQTSLIRELSIYHSRMGGFRDQTKFGKNAGEVKPKTTIQIVSDEQMKQLIESLVGETDKDKIEMPITDHTEVDSEEGNAEEEVSSEEDEINRIIKEDGEVSGD